MEIIHVFASCDVESISLATKLYVSLLLADVSYLTLVSRYNFYLLVQFCLIC